MNSNVRDYEQSSQIRQQTIHPYEKSIQHQQQHVSQYRCSHMNKKSPPLSNSVVDYPYVLLNNQQIRDLTDVYRREKDFLEQRKKCNPSDEIFSNIDKENCQAELKYDTKDYCYEIPTNSESSLPGRIFHNFINGIKISVEFLLFFGYVIGRRNELFECHYPFQKSQSYNSQVNHNYPFVRRATYSDEMKKLNTIREQVNRTSFPVKHTTTNTYYDIH